MNTETKILNPQLALAITAARHGDLIVVGDPGLPIPAGVPEVNLSLMRGIPSFGEVCRAILGELKVEKVVVAEEMREAGSSSFEELSKLLATVGKDQGKLQPHFVSHDELKKQTQTARLIVVHGDTKPYTNAIFVAGVDFAR
jgi:D-ribose pyranase